MAMSAFHELTQEDSLLQIVLQTVLDGMIVIDSAGCVQSFNRAAEKIFGYSPDEVIGRNVKVLMPAPYQAEHDGYLHNFLTTGEKKVIGIGREVSARRKDGSIFPLELGVNEMRIGEARLFVGTIRDITHRKASERRLKDEAGRLQAVMNTVLDGLITIDERGVIQTLNPAAVTIFGYEPIEVVGKNIRMLMPEPYHSEHDTYLANYASSHEAKIIGIGREVSGRRKDGTVFPMELGVNEMSVDGARVYVGTVRDITARKRAEEDLRAEASRLQTVMNTVLDGLITIDSAGTIRSFNQSATRIFDYQPADVIGQNVKMLMPEPYHSEHDGYLQHYQTTGEKRVIGIGREVAARRKDRSIFPIELGVNEMWVDGERMFVGTIRDISERKDAEAAIHSFVEKLKRSNQELDDFAYIASHDLKEPIRGLSNNAVFLKEDYADDIDESGNRRLDRMVYLCRRMETLVDDLLYFSRLGRQELAIQPTDLNIVIKDIELMLDLTLQEQNVEIVVPAPLPSLVCDLPRVTEVFRNLITNAVKYNLQVKKRIEIGVDQTYHGRSVAFYVKDNGIGIEPRFYNDIFRIFKRLNEEDDAIKGTGVGLTFVKKIIERHGGRIWLESMPGEGTTFYFTLSAEEDI